MCIRDRPYIDEDLFLLIKVPYWSQSYQTLTQLYTDLISSATEVKGSLIKEHVALTSCYNLLTPVS